MHAGRLGADVEGLGDLAVGQSLGHQHQHLELTGTEAELDTRGRGRVVGRGLGFEPAEPSPTTERFDQREQRNRPEAARRGLRLGQ